MELSAQGPVEGATEEALRYLAWKKNSPFLYETMLTFELPWPSLTVEWHPEVNYSRHEQQLILGTTTSGEAPEYLRMTKLTLPNPQFKNIDTFNGETGTLGGYYPEHSEMKITQCIDFSGGVNKARYMPQNPNILAAISSTGQAGVWDVTKFSSHPSGKFNPSITLSGHEVEGLGLDWSEKTEGILATADNSGRVLIWDIQNFNPEQHFKPTWEVKTAAVADIEWNPHHDAILATVSDDATMSIFDYRARQTQQQTPLGYTPSAFAWNKSNPYLAAIGFESGAIELWDIRQNSYVLGKWQNHEGAVSAIDWNLHHPAVLSSGSDDCTVCIWDASLIEDPLRFCHGGHTAPVGDISWNPAEPAMLASVSTDNALHVFRPGLDIIGF